MPNKYEMIAGNTFKRLDHLLYSFYIVFFITLICSFRWVSSFLLLLLLITGLLKNRIETGSFFNKNLKNPFIVYCCIFYLLQFVSLFYTNNVTETLVQLRIKSGIILIPLTLCCNNYLTPVTVQKLLRDYVFILSAGMLYCFGIAVYKYIFLYAGSGILFYHSLVSPFGQNAVQVSLFLFIGVIYLVDRAGEELYIFNKSAHLLLIIYFICCILLLSSKLVIIFSACCFVYFFFRSDKKKQRTPVIIYSSIIICVAIASICFTNNPVSRRFNEIISGDLSLVEKQKFTPAIYFNGLQFRLLQWRFVSQILTENNAWVLGVNPGDAQELLDQKYISTNMYIGDAKDGGFLGYNTHNQFLQSILQSGILGLLAFLLLCYSMVKPAFKSKARVVSAAIILILLYGFSDSYLESQYGVILFTFFPLFLYCGYNIGIKNI